MAETPGQRARRERHERIWPTAKEKAKRAKPRPIPKALAHPVEPIPDEVEVIDEQQSLDAAASE